MEHFSLHSRTIITLNDGHISRNICNDIQHLLERKQLLRSIKLLRTVLLVRRDVNDIHYQQNDAM
jgi:hypothetical protein